MKKIKIIIIIIFIIIFIGIISYKDNDKTKNDSLITINKMYEIIDNGIIIDVRVKSDYDDGHIKNSINIPLEEIDTIKDIIPNKEEQIFIYCNIGQRSSEAFNYLNTLGYNNIYDVGGIKNQNIELVN